MGQIENKNRLDWLRWRQSGLGGSDIMQIVLPEEQRPYGGPFDVWVSKKQEIQIDSATDAMALGNWLERPIAEWVAEETGTKLIEAEPVQGPQEWMRCTPDFWLQSPDDTRQGLECKLSGKGRMWADGVPPYVQLQALWCMICTDTDVWNVGAYLPNNWKRDRWLVTRDAELEQRVVGMVGEWWEKHVVGNVMPEIDASGECMKALYMNYPEHDGQLIDATEEHDGLLFELVNVNRAIADNTKRKKELNNLLASMTEDSRGIQSAYGKWVWDVRKGSARIDTKRLKAEQPEVYEQFKTTGEPSRTARFYPTKDTK